MTNILVIQNQGEGLSLQVASAPHLEVHVMVVKSIQEAIKTVLETAIEGIVSEYDLLDGNAIALLEALSCLSARIVPTIVIVPEHEAKSEIQLFRKGAKDLLIQDKQGHYLQRLPFVLERVLKEEQRYRNNTVLKKNSEAILGTVSDGMIGLDGANSITFVNTVAALYLNGTPASFVGKKIQEVSAHLGSSFLDAFQKAREDIQFRNQAVSLGEYVFEVGEDRYFVKVFLNPVFDEFLHLEATILSFRAFSESKPLKPEESKILSDLEVAIHANQLALYFHPQVDAVTQKLVGLEALIRWQHPQLGIVLPDVFIPVAEERGMISTIDQWAFNQACECCVTWEKQGLNSFKISVNLSVKELQREAFVKEIAETICRYDVNPSRLQFEMTESVFADDTQIVAHRLRQLKQMGFSIAIDDFGRGYSCLNYLSDLPIDMLKIDRTFIQRLALPDNERHRIILSAIIHLAKQLKVISVAEGIETQEQAEQLQTLGCDQLQGFLFARPMPFEEITDFIKESKA